ncbi:MAG: site-specific integrase [Ardenticatenaceae bacterium]|nr:site-specific integrase [Ardenticatenaceae bacterium]
MLKEPVKSFVANEQESGRFYAALQKYLLKKHRNGLSPNTLNRIYYSLFPIGRDLENPAISELTRRQIQNYVDRCWLTFASETMRTRIGDIREFFAWCKKMKLTKGNLAKRIDPIQQKPGRYRRARSAEEDEIERTINCLVSQLANVVYRDVFGNLVADTNAAWTLAQRKLLRDLFVLVFIYETGCRVGELAALGTAAVESAIKPGCQVYSLTVYGKTKDRDYHFTQRTAELWYIWQSIRPKTFREYAVVGWGQGHDVAPMLPNGISQMLYRRSKEAGIRPFRGQWLRHAKVRRSKKAVGLGTSSQLIDHSNPLTTSRYGIEDDRQVLLEAAAKTGLVTDPFRPRR